MLGGYKIGKRVLVMGPHDCAVNIPGIFLRGKNIKPRLVMQRSSLHYFSRFLAAI
jgi:hypothetical protein